MFFCLPNGQKWIHTMVSSINETQRRKKKAFHNKRNNNRKKKINENSEEAFRRKINTVLFFVCLLLDKEQNGKEACEHIVEIINTKRSFCSFVYSSLFQSLRSLTLIHWFAYLLAYFPMWMIIKKKDVFMLLISLWIISLVNSLNDWFSTDVERRIHPGKWTQT